MFMISFTNNAHILFNTHKTEHTHTLTTKIYKPKVAQILLNAGKGVFWYPLNAN